MLSKGNIINGELNNFVKLVGSSTERNRTGEKQPVDKTSFKSSTHDKEKVNWGAFQL